MKAFEYFEVECPEETGAESYRQITEDVLGDLDLIKTIGRLHIYIDPKVPIFLAVGIVKKLPRLIHVRDFANVLEKEVGVVLDISEETYLSHLLRILWDMFGRNLVEQPDRWTIVIKSPEAKREKIEDLVVYDPGESLYKDLIFGLQNVAPEGFKVRRQRIRNNVFCYVASENTLEEEMIRQLVSEKLALIGVEQ